eukprot:1087623-Amphidinium_carterae.1
MTKRILTDCVVSVHDPMWAQWASCIGGLEEGWTPYQRADVPEQNATIALDQRSTDPQAVMSAKDKQS